jgi:hypothetical protein
MLKETKTDPIIMKGKDGLGTEEEGTPMPWTKNHKDQ